MKLFKNFHSKKYYKEAAEFWRNRYFEFRNVHALARQAKP